MDFIYSSNLDIALVSENNFFKVANYHLSMLTDL